MPSLDTDFHRSPHMGHQNNTGDGACPQMRHGTPSPLSVEARYPPAAMTHHMRHGSVQNVWGALVSLPASTKIHWPYFNNWIWLSIIDGCQSLEVPKGPPWLSCSSQGLSCFPSCFPAIKTTAPWWAPPWTTSHVPGATPTALPWCDVAINVSPSSYIHKRLPSLAIKMHSNKSANTYGQILISYSSHKW